jgi:hypothetical protein
MGYKNKNNEIISIFNNQNIDIRKMDNSKINIYSKCKFAEKIIIEGYFSGKLILNIDGHNKCTGVFSGDDKKGYIIFDLSHKEENKIISKTLDLSLINNIKIVGNYTKLSNNINIYVLGSYIINYKSLYGYVKNKYNNEFYYTLCMNHPTVAITLYKNEIFNCKFRLMINDYITDYFEYTNTMGLITFNNINNLFIGAQNEYLTEDINKKSLNMSRINSFYIIFECDVIDKIAISQMHYNVLRHGHIAFSN